MGKQRSDSREYYIVRDMSAIKMQETLDDIWS